MVNKCFVLFYIWSIILSLGFLVHGNSILQVSVDTIFGVPWTWVSKIKLFSLILTEIKPSIMNVGKKPC